MQTWASKLLNRGWPWQFYLEACRAGDEDKAARYHPLNWTTEDETELHADEIMDHLGKEGLHLQIQKGSKSYLATIQVLVKADSEAEACDALSEGLRGIVRDWSYLRVGGQYLSPSETYIREPYEEGDAF